MTDEEKYNVSDYKNLVRIGCSEEEAKSIVDTGIPAFSAGYPNSDIKAARYKPSVSRETAERMAFTLRFRADHIDANYVSYPAKYDLNRAADMIFALLDKLDGGETLSDTPREFDKKPGASAAQISAAATALKDCIYNQTNETWLLNSRQAERLAWVVLKAARSVTEEK